MIELHLPQANINKDVPFAEDFNRHMIHYMGEAVPAAMLLALKAQR